MPKAVQRQMKVALLPNGGSLVTKYDLDCTSKEKPTVWADDFYEMMSTIWKSADLRFTTERSRALMWMYQHFAAYTGARPGALVEARPKGRRREGYNMRQKKDEDEDRMRRTVARQTRSERCGLRPGMKAWSRTASAN